MTVFDDLIAEPRALATGPDGNVWFTAKDKRPGESGDAVGRITPKGEVAVTDDGLTGETLGIAAGPDGALWFTEPKAKRIGRVTTTGKLSEFPVTGEPTGIAAGPDGALWFTDAKGAVGRITTDGTVTAFPGAGAQPRDITAGPDGALWYTLDHGVGRITTAGAITTVDLPGSEPVAITAGPDQAVYLTDAKVKSLRRIDARVAPVDTVTPEPSATAAPTATSTPTSAPGPALQDNVVVDRKKGKIRIRKPGKHFETLDMTENIPIGSLIDARDGSVALQSQTKDGTQKGTFRGGLFTVRQRAGGHTDIYLRGKLDCGRRKLATASKHKPKKRRKVWGKDSGGAFSTHGRDSVTTVRGTEWLTLDTCRGTITRVKSGSVVVRDRKTGKRHVVKAGHSFLVRHRR